LGKGFTEGHKGNEEKEKENENVICYLGRCAALSVISYLVFRFSPITIIG
jgi:hypothetical protein